MLSNKQKENYIQWEARHQWDMPCLEKGVADITKESTHSFYCYFSKMNVFCNVNRSWHPLGGPQSVMRSHRVQGVKGLFAYVSAWKKVAKE